MTVLERITIALCVAVLAATFGAICYTAGERAGALAMYETCKRQ